MSIGSLGIKTHAVGLAPSIEAIARSVNRRGIVVRVRASDFTQPLGKMSASASEFTKSLEASNARVLAFGASAAIIGGVTTSFAQLVIQATKVEKILADINAVLGTTAGNLQKFGDGLFNVARNTSQSLEVAAEAALEFSRQGLSMEETLKRTNDALILTRLTGLKAAESVKGLTAAVNGFADVGLTTTEIINKLAAVDVKFAVSADDLVNALARAGAVAQDAGVNFDQLIGAVTAAQQITARGGAVIGNSFKTIFTRIQRSSTLDRLQELGIAVRDIRGNTLPALTVLQNLSSSYDNLAVSTKAAVAEQVGGVFQINVLKAALKDLSKETSIYSQATMTSSQASNEAYQKNAMLQKTLASIANQTLTTVRELTANLGELTIAPALKEFLESANNILGTISDMIGSKEGESLGADFAKGIARGLGGVLAGPGMIALVLIFGKLFSSALKFAKNSVKDLLQIKTIKDQELEIQESIVNAMLRNVELSEQLVKLDGNQVKQEELVLSVLKKQTKEIEQQRQIAQNVAPALRRAGVQPNLIVEANKSKKTQNSASGFIPNYSKQPTPIEEMKEKAGAKEGGYVAGKVSTMSIPKMGRVVYNNNETVKRFKGMDQPAIMPPKSSKAGKQYEKEFAGKHGFDPYASYGLIPNFALEATKVPGTNILNLPKAKMITETTQSNFKGEVTKGWKTLEAPLDNIVKSAMSYRDEFEALKKLGVDVLRRKMYFSSQKSSIKQNEMRAISRDQKKLSKSKGFASKNQHKITGNRFEGALFKGSLKQKGYYPSWTGAYTAKGRQKGEGDENFKVDFFAPGRKPIESKYGKYTPPNLIAKSIRLYSDQYIEKFLSKHGNLDLAENMANRKLQDSAQMLTSLGYKDVGPKEVLRAGLSGGLIPNFGYQNWGMGRKSQPINWKKNQKTGKMSILSGSSSNLDGFGQYLKQVSEKYPDKVKASAAEAFITRAKAYHSVIEKEKAEVNKNTPIGFGRQGRKHYDQKAFVSSRERDVDINGLFIKKLNNHVKQYNKHGYFAADKIERVDSFVNQGLVPNFAFKNTPIRLDGGFGRRGRNISDTESGSFMNYTTNAGNREIDFLQSYRKGDAYRMFQREGQGKFMKQGGAYTSPTLKQQKSFKQGSSTNFEDLIYAFPQLQYRMQPNMITSGKMIHGPAGQRFSFKNLKELKSITNGLDRKQFRDALGAFPGIPGLDVISIQDLTTTKSGKGKGDNIYKQYAEGLIPNFESQNWQNEKSSGTIDDQLKEVKDRAEALEDKKGSKNHSHYNDGLIPNFNKNFTLTKGNQLIDARYAYKVGRNQVFKPDPGQNPKSTKLKGRIANISKSGNSIDFDSIKPIASLSVKRINGRANSGQSIAFNTKAGHAYEKAIANTYVTKGWTGVGPAELDFFDTKWAKRNIPNQNKLKTPYGQIGPDHLTRYWKYADAYSGATHGPRLILSKLIAKGLVSKNMIQDAVNTGSLDLTKKLPSFAEIVGVGNDSPYLSSSIFNPFATNGVNVKTFKNLTGAIKKPAYGNTDGQFGIKFNQDHFTALNKPSKSQGLIPNFANPLGDAISREKEALRERGSAADIYIDQDNRLKNPKNPAGLLVANTRDEPKSGSQGVNRAISMGMDPKTHGASNGIIPNYNMRRRTGSGFKNYKKQGDDNSAKETVKGLENVADSAEGAAKGMENVNDRSGDLMMKMMGLTTITYALEGAMGEASAEASNFQKGMSIANSAIMGLSQASMLGMVANPKDMISQGGSALFAPKGAEGATKGSRTMGLMKGLGGSLLGVGMAAAALIPIYESLKTNTTLLDGPLDTLRKSAEKTSKGIDALGNAISTHQEIESTRTKMVELSNSAEAQTFDGEMKRLKLSANLVQQERALADQASILASSLNLTGSEVQRMTSGTAKGMQALQNAMLKYQKTLTITAAVTALKEADEEKDFRKRQNLKEIQNVSLAKLNQSEFKNKDESDKVFDRLISLIPEKNIESVKFKPMSIGFGSSYADTGQRIGNDKKEKDLLKDLNVDIQQSTDVPDVVKDQVREMIASGSKLKDIKAYLEKQKELVSKFNDAAKDNLATYITDKSLIREIAQERAEILSSMRLEQEATQAQANLAQKIYSNMIAGEEFRNKTRSSLGILSNAVQVEAEMATKRKQSEMQYTQDVQAANQQAVKARLDAVKNLLKEGSDDASATFSQLNTEFTETKKYEGTPTGTEITVGTFSPQSSNADERKKAFEGNLKDIQNKLEKAGHEELARKLEGVQSQKQANNKLLIYLKAAAEQGKLQETLASLQQDNVGVIHGQTDISKYNLEEIKKRLEQNKAFAAAEKAIRDQQLAIVEQEMHVSKNTLEGAKIKLEEYKKIKNPAKKIRDNLHEELDATIETAGMTKEISDATFATLDSQEYRQKATEAMATTLTEELGQEYKTLVNQGARIEAEAELRKNTELYAKLIAEKVKNERGAISNQITDRATTTQTNLKRDETGKNTFDYRTEDEVSKLTDSTINLRAQYEANKAANFYALEATEQLSQSQIKFSEEMDRLREKIKNKGFFQEGLNAVDRSGITATANVQSAQGKVAGYAEMGNTLRMAESSLELARAQKEKNIELNRSGESGGGNSLFSDTIAVRIAETNVELERFNETLANTAFDSVKDGFRSMVDMMGDSTKDMGDMMTSFFGTIAKAISDKLLDRALNQLTSGIFDAFDLDGFNQGGIVGYNNGGSVGNSGAKMPNTSRTQTPAMLTAGEYVVRKKIVDRLGVSSLDKMNKFGSVESSLTDLYSAPNEESFEMSTEGSAPIPPIMRFNEGGRIQSMMSNITKPISKLLSQSGSSSNNQDGDGKNVNENSYAPESFAKSQRGEDSISSMMKFNEGGKIESMMSSMTKPISKFLGQSGSSSNSYNGDGKNANENSYAPESFAKSQRGEDSISSMMKFNEGGKIESMMSSITKPISKFLNQNQSARLPNEREENDKILKLPSYDSQNFEQRQRGDDFTSSIMKFNQGGQAQYAISSANELNLKSLDERNSMFNSDELKYSTKSSSDNNKNFDSSVSSDFFKNSSFLKNSQFNQNQAQNNTIDQVKQFYKGGEVDNNSLDIKALNKSFSKLNSNPEPELSVDFKSKELNSNNGNDASRISNYIKPKQEVSDGQISRFDREQPLLKLNRGGYTLGSPHMDAAWDNALQEKKPGVLERGWNAVKSSLSSSSSDSALTKIAKGAGTTAGVMYANYEDREDTPGPAAPTAPSTARLNTTSDLDLDPSSKLMSTRARVGGDSYSKQYGDYLLKKYQHDVDKQNEKVESRAQMWKGIVNSIGVALGTSAVMKGIQGVKGLYEARGGPEAIEQRWREEGINNLGDLREKKPQAFANYQDQINKTRAKEGLDRMTAENIIAAEPKLACSNGVCDVSSEPTFDLPTDSRIEQLKSIKNLSNKASNASYNLPPDQRVQGLQGLRGKEFLDYSLPSNNRISALQRLKGDPERLSSGGKVKGPSGIDKVGPVMLDRGEYVVKASSVNNIEKQYPGFFDQLNSMKMNQGGMVGDKPQPNQPKPDSAPSSNVTVNINVASDGSSSASGGGPSEQEMAKKIKEAVVGVISQEKRVGGMLRG